MIKTLRKRHLQVWVVLAAAIPAGIISAVLAVPKQQWDKLLQPAGQNALPIVVKTINTQSYTAYLRCSTDSALWQLQWVNKDVLTFPTALLYKLPSPQTDIDNPAGNAVLVGRIESQGAYYFPLQKDTARQYFLLYDILHHQKIGSFIF
jgi:hypothetical protein